MTLLLRVALVIGCAIDAFVGVLALVAPDAFMPVLDIPTHDRIALLFGGGEYLIVAALYLLVLRDPRRFRVLFWLCALDQAFAVVLPGLLVAHGDVPATFKTVAPIPVQALMAALFAIAAMGRAEAPPAA